MTVEEMKAALRKSMTERFARALDEMDYFLAVILILASAAIDRGDDMDLYDTLREWETEGEERP